MKPVAEFMTHAWGFEWTHLLATWDQYLGSARVFQNKKLEMKTVVL